MIKTLERFSNLFSNWLNWAGVIAVILMLSFVAFDVLGAKAFSFPLPGGYELVSLLGILVVSFGVSRTYALGRHIRVDFVVMRLPVIAQRIINIIASLLTILFLVLIVWRVTVFAYDVTVRVSYH